MKASKWILSAALVFCIVPIYVPVASAAKSEKVTQKAGETVDAAAQYARESKEEFQQKMRENLAVIEEDIADLKSRAATATVEARETMSQQIETLEIKRDNLKKRLDKVTESSDRAWKRMKAGVEKAWKEVKVAYTQAEAEFDSEEREAQAKKNQKTGN